MRYNLEMLESIEEIRTFCRIVDEGSLSAAARSMSLSVNAVSRRLAQLESRMGVRLAERTTHTSLQSAGMLTHFKNLHSSPNAPIGAGTRKHLVDAQHVERVLAHAQMERVLAAVLHQVLVGADSRRLERLR